MAQPLRVDNSPNYTIAWKKLPEHFELPDDPVENIKHPFLATALTESLEIAGLIQPHSLMASNFGLCAEVQGNTVVKAPDWLYVPFAIPVPEGLIRKSYTPYLEGDVPAVVMEFLSDTKGEEYSDKTTPPYGKWFFYEQILQVPWYVIFNPTNGRLEIYEWRSGSYRRQPLKQKRGWIAPLNLFLGVWHGTKVDQETGYWLRWWDSSGRLLRWSVEQIAYEQQLVNQETHRADQAARIALREYERAEQERECAERERARAEQAEQRSQTLEAELARLKALLGKQT
jgi:Putative restriction endonuclease